ncbi:MAG: PorV/PorQ family protein, partial [candidate division Zixibacteria bacterium]|nr:PorV/PorQ family protein [candidate division Zixibacteria bacterium]
GGNFQWLGNNYFGFGINLFTIPDIEKRTGPTNDPIFTFNAHDFSIGASWGRMITNKLSVGLGLKMVYESIDNDDLKGYAADFGAVYNILPELRIGTSFRNVGPKVKFIEEKFDLPHEFRLGTSYIPANEILSGKWTIAGDLSKKIDSDMQGHFGVEYSYKDIIAPRLGYAFNYSDKDFSAGFGLRYQLYSFDYAYVPYSSDLGNSHHMSIGVWFK